MNFWRTKLRICVANLIIGCLIILISGINAKGQDIQVVDSESIAQNVSSDEIYIYTISKKVIEKDNTEHESEYTDVTFLEEDIEEGIKIEDWMLDSDHSFWIPVKEEIEDDIELEEWMLDLSLWK